MCGSITPVSLHFHVKLDLAIKRTFVPLGLGVPGVLYEPVTPGEKNRIGQRASETETAIVSGDSYRRGELRALATWAVAALAARTAPAPVFHALPARCVARPVAASPGRGATGEIGTTYIARRSALSRRRAVGAVPAAARAARTRPAAEAGARTAPGARQTGTAGSGATSEIETAAQTHAACIRKRVRRRSPPWRTGEGLRESPAGSRGSAGAVGPLAAAREARTAAGRGGRRVAQHCEVRTTAASAGRGATCEIEAPTSPAPRAPESAFRELPAGKPRRCRETLVAAPLARETQRRPAARWIRRRTAPCARRSRQRDAE